MIYTRLVKLRQTRRTGVSYLNMCSTTMGTEPVELDYDDDDGGGCGDDGITKSNNTRSCSYYKKRSHNER